MYNERRLSTGHVPEGPLRGVRAVRGTGKRHTKGNCMRLAMKTARVGTIVLLLLMASMAMAQATADLHVEVKDPNGAAVNNAVVRARNLATNLERVVTAGVEGQYGFALLPPGRYAVTVEATGFAKVVLPDVTITVGQVAELPVALKLATAVQEISVNAEAEMVETQRTSMATTIEERRIENLPINGRNYINFAETNSQIARDDAPSIGAAPTSGLNSGGQRARNNLVNVDGMDAVDNSTNGVRSTVSQEAVQEFQVVTNGYAAEYGRASGAVINIITKSGSNEFHGDVFGYLRNRKIQAVNPFSNVSDPAYTRVQAGFTAGGAIKKDKTFWFLSYETTRRRETGFSNIGANNFDLSSVNISPYIDAAVFPGYCSLFGGCYADATAQQAALFANPGATPLPLVIQYGVLVGATSGTALNGAVPTWAIPFLGPAAGGNPAQFITSCSLVGLNICSGIPASFHPLNSIIGNYPVTEGTTLVGLRLDHRINSRQNLMLRVNVSPSTVTGIQVNAQNQNFGQNAYSRTSNQQYRDVSGTAQHAWTIGDNKVNEFRFQYARRGLLYNYASQAPGGGDVANNIAGYAYNGREPFSYVKRTEQRYEFVDNFSWMKGNHSIKFGADVNYLPLVADFTVNFGGLFDFGAVPAALVSSAFRTLPELSPVQAYGAGLPQDFVQGVGNPHDSFSNKTLGVFLQDTWRIKPNLTLNYGVRYDIEWTPTFKPINSIAADAEKKLGIVEGIPVDSNNVAPRIGLAWDPWNDGKTVIRASYGIFYDHPLLALAFDSDVADGAQAPQLAFGLAAPSAGCNVNATNIFQGLLTCPASFAYLPGQQRFDASNQNSVWVNQNYLAGGVPLAVQPFGFPTAANFQYPYSNQANLTLERDLGHNFALTLAYNFNGGRHLNRPINTNPVNTQALVQNWRNAYAAYVASGGTTATSAAYFNPNAIADCGIGPAGPYVPAAFVSFFRPSGVNPSYAPYFGACAPVVAMVVAADGLNTMGDQIPFSDMIANFSSGSSVYHGFTANLRKRFGNHYEFLMSYTWSHAIDDSTDLQSTLAPQDSRNPSAERSVSLFDQRHRFVFSAVYQTGKVGGGGFKRALLSDWTLAPIVDLSSGRPYNIITGIDDNFDLGSKTDRPNIVAAGAPVNPVCGNVPVPSKFSPTGWLQAPCWLDGNFVGNMGRNAGLRPMVAFADLRIARRIPLGERLALDAMMDVFNLPNKYNIADVNPLFTQQGQATAAFDPRQFQFALKLSW
jgi:hypothetical protein